MPTSTDRPVLVALGSNIEPEANLPEAVRLISDRLPVEGVSRVYEAEPVGAPGTPRFLNAAVALATDWPPVRIKFELLRPIEERLGRVRSADRNAPRTIDLDVAMIGNLVMDEGGIRIPDPDVLRRAHVALPLADLAPDLVHPLTGDPLAAIAARFAGAPGIRVYEDLSLR